MCVGGGGGLQAADRLTGLQEHSWRLPETLGLTGVAAGGAAG